jgi:putative phosphotransacetylase
MNTDLAKEVISRVLDRLKTSIFVTVGVSNRHVHLSQKDLGSLFGQGYELTEMKALKQPGQYAAEEKITLKGPRGTIENVRILGPIRKETQVELSLADGRALGLSLEVRESGKLKDSAPITLIGPKGQVSLDQGAIAAYRHIHMPDTVAKAHSIEDGMEVSVRTFGERSVTYNNVLVRVSSKYALEMHVDVEEANAAGIKNNDQVEILL